MNIIFYSQKCSSCHDLLLLLKNEDLLKNFTLFCVDNKLDQVPKQITHVPTMIVSNINKPLIVQEAFEWVNQIKFLRNQSSIQTKSLSKEPKEFSEIEMLGFSDKYSYTEKDKPLKLSYFNIGQEEQHSIYTAPQDNPLNKSEQDYLIRDLQLNREQEDKQIQVQAQEEQYNIIQNYNI